MIVIAAACKQKQAAAVPEEENGFDFAAFAGQFQPAALPYQLTDTGLQKNTDTAVLRSQQLLAMIPDSLTEKLFGKKAKVRYTPLARIETGKSTYYFIVKGSAGARKSAVLLQFGEGDSAGAAFPFLVPDADASTRQISSIDKGLSITRTIMRKMPDDVVAEGKDVYVYNGASKQFDLIMTDLLDDGNLELQNPIDTLPRQNKLSGDYNRDKRSLVSIRDGRKPNLLTVFIHIEEDNGACTGEIKGDAEITAPETAVYRQAGDPCVLELSFGKNAVTLKEAEGCGARRGLECSFNGIFKRKKDIKAKTKERPKKQPSGA